MYQSSVEVEETLSRFEGNCLLELCEGIIYLVEHHHTIAPVGVVLRIFVIEADGSAKVVHGFLVVTDGHEGFTTFRVVAGVGGTLVVVWG
jgi:hypothetical protein